MAEGTRLKRGTPRRAPPAGGTTPTDALRNACSQLQRARSTQLKPLTRCEPAPALARQIIAFFPTARQTQFAAEALLELGVPAMEIHSRCVTWQ